tara:strand:+ start:1337 stop:1489 length:153 start_codon:yes stop_codon:yes gene_type:complete
MKKLTKNQKRLLLNHSQHHSKKHMKMMRESMRLGSSFKSAHSKAQKEVGT